MSLYDALDAAVKNVTSRDVGFNALVSEQPTSLGAELLRGFRERYDLIKQFQKVTQELFAASLRGAFDPELAQLVLNEVPAGFGRAFHQEHAIPTLATPTFFRTDEARPGKIVELQCPGSLWGEYELLHDTLPFNSKAPCLSGQFSDALRQHLGRDPIVHHLMDNASVPHGMDYFIQKTRPRVRYWGYDKGVTPQNCNFVRAHDFFNLVTHNHFHERFEAFREGRFHFDAPPSVLFDQKMAMTLPFWEKTRAYYTDAIRGLFPETQLITPSGVTIRGETLSLRDFAKMPRPKRSFYIKYAGNDLRINWGGKGVYFAGSLSQVALDGILSNVVSGYSAAKYWILQEAIEERETVSYFDRQGTLASCASHPKWSGFYGPNGLMGVLVMRRPFYKVHGAENTIFSLGI